MTNNNEDKTIFNIPDENKTYILENIYESINESEDCGLILRKHLARNR